MQRQAKSGFRTMITAGCLGDRQTKKVHRKGVAGPQRDKLRACWDLDRLPQRECGLLARVGLQD